MTCPVYYNEWEDYPAQWLENLIAAGHLPAGDVDRRDIREVGADDLKGYDQCHFFAGIGGWPLALALAGWHGPVWTGSCPCQPLSSAGQRQGHADERHLWPAFYELIAERRPATVFGEQVASALGREWLAGVRADLEGLDYALGAADLCAAGAGEKARARISYPDHSFEWREIIVGAPHIRQRLFWVADAGCHQRGARRDGGSNRRPAAEPSRLRDVVGLADAYVGDTGAEGLQRGGQHGQLPPDGCAVSRLGDPQGFGCEGQRQPGSGDEPQQSVGGSGSPRRLGNTAGERRQGDQRRARPGDQPELAGAGFWRDSELIPCADGKARRVEPGTFPLAHGIPNRVGQLRAYGNAITPQQGAIFVTAFMECRP